MRGIPAWAVPKTTVSVNGQRALTGPRPGEFAGLERTWKTGDRIEVDMLMVLEAVDPEQPNLVVAVHGPPTLFVVDSIPENITRADLLRITQALSASIDWQARTAAGTLTLRPFPPIVDEYYRLYLKIES